MTIWTSETTEEFPQSDRAQESVPSRFDFERQIMSCWGIVDDLEGLIKHDCVTSEIIEATAKVYSTKFEILFSIFEKMIAARKIK